MKPNELKRRGFLGAALLSAGAAIGTLVRKSQPIQPVTATPGSRFAYDTSEFEKTDPALLRYKPDGQFETNFQSTRRLASHKDELWIAGDQSLKSFSPDGKLRREIRLDFKPRALHVTTDGIFVASLDFIASFESATGKQIFRSAPLAGKSCFTAIRPHKNTLYVADAGSREILICDRHTGAVIDRFGKQSETNPGFAIPSAYFDLHIAADDRLRVANTGRLRIETYTLDGRFESAWGEAGMKIDRFCGCCNPVYFALTPSGEFVTSEKGLARLNLYSAEGKFKAAIAGPDTLVEDKELARRACVDCRVGAGFDVAVAENGRVYALDPYRKTVRAFQPI